MSKAVYGQCLSSRRILVKHTTKEAARGAKTGRYYKVDKTELESPSLMVVVSRAHGDEMLNSARIITVLQMSWQGLLLTKMKHF